MKRRTVIALVTLAAFAGGCWYLLTPKDREASAAINEFIETANKLLIELASARNELELARGQADEAAKVGDLTKQRQSVERMRSLELKILDVEKRLRALPPQTACKNRKSSVEVKAPDADKAQKAPDRSLEVAQSKGCGPSG